MNSQFKIFLLCVFIGITNLCFSETFSEFNAKLSIEHSTDKLNKFALEELKKYTETGKVYYLYNSKYAEYFAATRGKKTNESLKILSWIIEDGRNANSEQLAWVNYNLASTLTALNATKISQEYANNALIIAKNRDDSNLLPIIYSLIGSNYYIQREFSKASVNYERAFDLYPSDQLLYKASMLNNMALCYMNLSDYGKAHTYYKKALRLLNRIRNKNKSEETFQIVVKGNIGSILNKLGQIEESIKILEEEVEYYFSNPENLQLAIPPTIELLKLYQLKGNSVMTGQIVNKIIFLEQKVGQPSQFPILTDALYQFYSENGMTDKAFAISKSLIRKLNAYSDWNIKQSNDLNEILYRDKLIHMKKDSRTQKIILNSAIEEKKKSQLMSVIVIIIGILISAIAVLVYISIKKNSLKNSLIQKQRREIELNKNKILQNEIRLNEDKIANLAMNLNLKKETEKAFLTKINELKRKKNIDAEQTLKDLQLSVSNLLSIDKKMIHTDLETDEINKKFKRILQDRYPGLSKTDLDYCCYFRLNLSAKEIGSIQGISDVSVRVIKNRIKNKLGLHADVSLNSYLNGLSLAQEESANL